MICKKKNISYQETSLKMEKLLESQPPPPPGVLTPSYVPPAPALKPQEGQFPLVCRIFPTLS